MECQKTAERVRCLTEGGFTGEWGPEHNVMGREGLRQEEVETQFPCSDRRQGRNYWY